MIALDTWPWQYWAQRRPDECAVILQHTPISWRDLTADIDRQSACFYAQGVREGQCVALRGKNSYSLLMSYLAILRLGARVLPINPQIPTQLFNQLLTNLNVDYGWQDNETGKYGIWPDSVKLLTKETVINNPDHLKWVDWSENRPATMTLTSGSSGIPKAAVHSLLAHLENAEGLLQLMTFDRNDSWLLSLPMFHVSGQGIIWRWLLKGAKLVVRQTQSLSDMLQDCTHASLVPTQLWRLLTQAESTLTLKQVLLGGAMIPTELTQQAERQGIHCWCGYGLTEMASTVCAKKADGLPGVGNPLPKRELKLKNGQIYLKGAGIALGYWLNDRIVPFVDAQGWFHTRDKGIIENGELRILGRLDNEFFSGGEGIQPEDIERVLNAHPLIEQAFIVPRKDPEFGDRPVAVVQAKQPMNLEQILQWLEGKVARFQLPVAYYDLPTKLMNGGIKISRKAICEWVAGKETKD